MNKWENNLEGLRISLSDNLRKDIKQHRDPFLYWINQQREANNDSLHWWMTHLAGRNNFVSKFFLYIIQISELEKWIKDNNNLESNILVVCEDGFILKALNENLNGLCSVELKAGWQFGFIIDLLLWLGKAIIAIGSQFYLFFVYYRAAKRSRPSDLTIPTGEVYLIHQCLDDNALNKEGPLSCRYFTVLPNILESEGKQVVRLPWITPSVTLSIDKVFEKLRNSNCLIPEDWLRINDYLWSIWNSIKSSFSLSYNCQYPNIDIKYLIYREKLLQLGEGNAIFWRYVPMMKKWGKNLKSIITYDHFENMVFEHALVDFTKRVVPRSFSVGYYHSLTSKNFLGYHSIKNEWKSKKMPDRIVTNGKISWNLLIDQGIPRERLVIGPALRQSYNFNSETKGENRNDLLILLSLSLESNIELLTKLYQHVIWINENIKSIIRIKPHPFIKVKKLMNEMNWEHLPDKWKWDTNNIERSLERVHCCIVMNSASVYDAVLKGCSILSIQSEFNLTDNYLDIFNDNHPITNAVQSKGIPRRLEEIFITKRSYFNSEFKKLKIILEKGLNPVDDKILKVFLPSTLKKENYCS